MKGFIELRAIGGHKVFFPIEQIAFGNSDIGTIIFFNSSTYGVDETMDEIADKIEAAERAEMSGGNIIINGISSEPPKQEPRQNIYYRTADRLPTAEDADASGELLTSNFIGADWFLINYSDARMYSFWAPCPKVEVRE